MKYLVWGLVLMAVFIAAAAMTYGVSHRKPAVAITPVPTPVLSAFPTTPIVPTPTPDSLSQSSTNPFEADDSYENPFGDPNYQNPF